ncbi:DUF1819 family protein [Anaerolineales bacterium HSG25]|nr:DUF1819 family protein [Anaerolineales bacterium HSG25]
MTNTQSKFFTTIQNLRDSGPISSRNTSKGALIQETFNLFKGINAEFTAADIRQVILVENTLNKSSYETRRKIWNAIKHRYLTIAPQWVGEGLHHATKQGIQSVDFLSLAYLHYTLRDRLTFELVMGPIWERWQHGKTLITRDEGLMFLQQLAEQSPHINKWRDSTRKRLISMSLTALRDFGLLKGVQKKHIQQPAIANETVYHLICVLLAEGKQGRAILQAPDWRLFLWSEVEVNNALGKLAQQDWLNYERVGETVMLQLTRLPVSEDSSHE